MTAADACDLLDFWEAARWPLTRDQVEQLAVEWLGWTIEIDDGVPHLMNTVSGFTIPDVSTIGAKGGLSYLGFGLADTIREVTPESRRFLGDAFALAVRGGEVRWGAPAVRAVRRRARSSPRGSTGGRRRAGRRRVPAAQVRLDGTRCRATQLDVLAAAPCAHCRARAVGAVLHWCAARGVRAHHPGRTRLPRVARAGLRRGHRGGVSRTRARLIRRHGHDIPQAAIHLSARNSSRIGMRARKKQLAAAL